MNNTPKFCENCGTTLEEGAKFCEECGNPVETPSVHISKSFDTSSLKQSYEKKRTTVPRSLVKIILGIVTGTLLIFAGNEVYQMITGTSTPANGLISNNQDYPTILTLSNGMEFVKIPAGEFDMGSPIDENRRLGNEGPVHRVKFSKAFYMGKYEITQKQWRDVMGTNPSIFKGDNLPVEHVSWEDIQEFINKLNEKEGANKYRLPSEAEWEYAARAGTTSDYFFGDDESKLGDYAWYAENSGSRPPKKGDFYGYDQNDWIGLSWNGKIHYVGQKKPNPWGLFDMYGNVRELVQDTYHGNYTGAPADGSAWESESDYSHIISRGGDWFLNAWYCRSASRFPSFVGTHDGGFRLVRIL